MDLKHTKKIRLYKIVRDSAEKFGEELQIEEFLDEAARALENVYKDGYKYSIGAVVVKHRSTDCADYTDCTD